MNTTERKYNTDPEVLHLLSTITEYPIITMMFVILPRSFAYFRNSLMNTTMNMTIVLYLLPQDTLLLNYIIKYLKRIRCLRIVLQYLIK